MKSVCVFEVEKDEYEDRVRVAIPTDRIIEIYEDVKGNCGIKVSTGRHGEVEDIPIKGSFNKIVASMASMNKE